MAKRIASTVWTRAGAALLACAWAGCESGSATAPSGVSHLSAKVDGAAWEADPIGIFANALAVSPGCLMVGGSQTKDGKTTSLTLTLYNLEDTGTYALGTGLSVYGGMGQVGQSAGADGKGDGWITPGTGLDGEIHVTRLSGGHITADFAYVAVPGKNNADTSKREVTAGHLDLDYAGTLSPVLDKHGGRLTASLAGKPYNAADIYASLKDLNGNAGVTLTTTTSRLNLSLSLAGITAPGTYAIVHKQPNPRAIIVGYSGGTAETCCWGEEGDSAEVVITELSSARVKGTFRGTLVPQAGKPAKSPLLVDGAFDVGIP